MEWDDINFAITTRAVPHNQSISAAAPVQILKPDPKRVAVVFSGPANNNLFVHFGDNPTLAQGFRISASQTAFAFWMTDFGEMPRLVVWASMSVAAENIEFYEIFQDHLFPTPGNL